MWKFVQKLISLFSGKAPKRPLPSFKTPKSSAKRYYPRDKDSKIKTESDIEEFIRKTSATYKTTTNGTRWVIDGRGAVIDGKHQSGDGSQKERQTKLLDFRLSVELKNFYFKNIKDGVVFRSKNSGVRDSVFDLRNGGEDAFSTSGPDAINFRVYNVVCLGRGDNDSDKALQINNASGARIERVKVHGFTTGMRIHDDDDLKNPEDCLVKNCEFISTNTGINASGGIKVKRSGLRYDGVVKEGVTNKGAKFA